MLNEPTTKKPLLAGYDPNGQPPGGFWQDRRKIRRHIWQVPRYIHASMSISTRMPVGAVFYLVGFAQEHTVLLEPTTRRTTWFYRIIYQEWIGMVQIWPFANNQPNRAWLSHFKQVVPEQEETPIDTNETKNP